MKINKELHPRSDVARLYVSRKNGGRGLIGCENGVKREENGLGWYIKNNIEPLLVAVTPSRFIYLLLIIIYYLLLIYLSLTNLGS